MLKKYTLAIVTLIFIIVAVAVYTIVEDRNNVKWLESFQAPVEAQLIQFSNIIQTREDKNCYPGTCYQVAGEVVNTDTKTHTFQFIVELYSGDKYAAQSSVVSIDNLGPGQSEQFKTNLTIGFGDSGILKPIPKIFSFDSKTFDKPMHCTRKITWLGRMESCRSGF
jgi:hypothetical protein